MGVTQTSIFLIVLFFIEKKHNQTPNPWESKLDLAEN